MKANKEALKIVSNVKIPKGQLWIDKLQIYIVDQFWIVQLTF